MLTFFAMLAAPAVPAPACPVVKPGAAVMVQIARIKDGDTFEGTCRDRFGFPEVYRLLDLDTPEKGVQAKCPEEVLHAKKASAFVTSMAMRAGMWVEAVVAPHKEKYGRYLVSAVFTINAERVDWRQALIDGGYAFAYDGGKKADWCVFLKEQSQ